MLVPALLTAGAVWMSQRSTDTGRTRSELPPVSHGVSTPPSHLLVAPSTSSPGVWQPSSSSRMVRGAEELAPSRRGAAAKRIVAAAAQRSRRLNESAESRSNYGRRRRVGPTTRKLYDIEVRQFLLAALLPSDAKAGSIDPVLDQQLTSLYFGGATLRALRYRLFAVIWHFVIPKSALPQSTSTFDGFAKDMKDSARDPVTWEETVLRSEAMFRADGTAEGADMAVANLLMFDLYARPMSLLGVRTTSLHQPVSAKGPLSCWNVTFFPATAAAASKTGTQDDTIAVGATSESRMWLNSLMPFLFDRSGPLVFSFKAPAFAKAFSRASIAANLPEAVPHQNRHGGPSADAAMGEISDFVLQTRGMWKQASSCLRYRKPGRYLRRLNLLTDLQRGVLFRSAERFLKVALLGFVGGLNKSPRLGKRKRVVRE
jgi:hypothetical protein